MTTYKNTIVVTGGTTGLGYEAALALAKQFPTHLIIIASRTHTDNAASKINKALSQDNTRYMKLDLADFNQVRDFVKDFAASSYPPISHLLLNAGLQISGPLTHTAAGYETTFAVNHLGHALLFYLLIPHLTNDCHITITSSGTHDPAQKTMVPDAKYTSAAELARPDAEAAKLDGRQRYSTSKLCNVLWTYALDRHIREQRKHWKVNAFDPGLMPGTGLARDAGAVGRFLWYNVLPKIIPAVRVLVRSPNVHTMKESGKNLAAVAVGEAGTVSAKYFEGRKQIPSSTVSHEVEKQDNLWNWTVKEVSEGKGERERFEKLL